MGLTLSTVCQVLAFECPQTFFYASLAETMTISLNSAWFWFIFQQFWKVQVFLCPKKLKSHMSSFVSDGWPSREACTLNTNCAFKLKAWTIIYIKCECWLNTEYQFLLIGERNAGDCDTRLWKMGGRGQGNELANNANCYTCAGGVLLIYLAPKCEEQREVCKPDCYKSSEKIWARLERDSGRGFQFWNFVYKVNCRHNGGKDGEAKIYLNRHLLCFIFTFA